MVRITLPDRVGILFPILAIKNPAQKEVTKINKENGNSTLATVMALSSKPTGSGLLTRIGMLWSIKNVDKPTIIIRKLEYKSVLFFNNEISIKGFFDLFSIKMNNNKLPLNNNIRSAIEIKFVLSLMSPSITLGESVVKSTIREIIEIDKITAPGKSIIFPIL